MESTEEHGKLGKRNEAVHQGEGGNPFLECEEEVLVIEGSIICILLNVA